MMYATCELTHGVTPATNRHRQPPTINLRPTKWRLLKLSGCCWRLLVVVGGCWLLLVVVAGGCW
eukprot:11175801-Lingulodinium_polyedra.AAC.1